MLAQQPLTDENHQQQQDTLGQMWPQLEANAHMADMDRFCPTSDSDMDEIEFVSEVKGARPAPVRTYLGTIDLTDE